MQMLPCHQNVVVHVACHRRIEELYGYVDKINLAYHNQEETGALATLSFFVQPLSSPQLSSTPQSAPALSQLLPTEEIPNLLPSSKRTSSNPSFSAGGFGQRAIPWPS